MNHIDKIKSNRKYVPLFVINIMKYIKLNITPGVSQRTAVGLWVDKKTIYVK